MVKKKLAHVIIACFYKEGFGYQENILPAKHSELGYDVTIITGSKDSSERCYINRNAIKVEVLNNNKTVFQKVPYLNCYLNQNKGLYKKLLEIRPDIIFVHGPQAMDNLAVVKYKHHYSNVKVFVDQHGDYYNMPIKPLKNWLIQKTVYKYIAQKLASISEIMWGVTPWRVEYLEKVYGIAPSKTGLLVMGGDEKLIDWENRKKVRNEIRERYGINENCFLIVSGGKIDKTKNIHLLMEAVTEINQDNLRLIIFGKLDTGMELLSNRYKHSRQVINIGWIESECVYPFFIASDLGFFPGTHSVLWEQSVASGLPCVFKSWENGMRHLDVGGNCDFLEDVTVESIKEKIRNLLNDPAKYLEMKNAAATKGRKKFSYIEIAKQSIQQN